MLNKVFLETDGLVVGGTQLVTSGGSVNIGNNIYVGANTVTSNLTVTGTFTYPKANAALPAFSAFGSSFVSALASTPTQIMYDRVEYDTNNCFNPTNQWLFVNGIYTPPWSWAPNVPGYYMIVAPVAITAITSANQILSAYLTRQNNTIAQQGISLGGGSNPTATITTIVYMNGVSDYLSVYAIQTSGSTMTIGSNQPYTRFTGCFLRPA